MAKAFLLAAALQAAGALPAWGEVEVQGNTLFSTGEILAIVDRGADGRDLRSAIAWLQQAYYSRGHIFARFQVAANPDSSQVLINIDEGKQARFGRVRLSGALHFEASVIEETIGASPGGPFDPAKLSSGIKNLLRMYDESGYPFVQVWVDSLTVNVPGNIINAAFFIMDGGQKRLEKVVITGLKKTRQEVAVALSGLKEGEIYSGSRLREAEGRLRAFDVFSSISHPKIMLSPDGRGVEAHIRVQEPSRTNSFTAALGYAKKEQSRPRVFSGIARVKLVNLGGSLKDLSIFWNHDGVGRSETSLLFRDRFFMGRAVGVGLSLHQVGMDTLYTWQSVGTEVTIPLRTAGRRRAEMNLAVNADRNVFSTGELLRSWRLRFTGGLSYVLGAGEAGSWFRFNSRFSLARKKSYERSTLSASLISQYIVEISTRFHIPLGTARIHSFTSYRGIESKEDLIPISEQFYLGGAGTLRGYRENQFHGPRVAFSRFEVRLGRRTREYLYLFADAGYVLQVKQDHASGPMETDLFRSGYGFGLRTVTKLGDVDLSFGVGEKISFQQTKVHIMLGYDF